MTHGNILDGKEGIEKLRLARKLCQESYGEFSALMARIYYNTGVILEEMRLKKLAYQCFRRNWLVLRQIYGINHCETKKAAEVLTDEDDVYCGIARDLGDFLPNDDHLGSVDMDYVERLRPLDDLDLSQTDNQDTEDEGDEEQEEEDEEGEEEEEDDAE